MSSTRDNFFGTDGIRGIYGGSVVSDKSFFTLGSSIAKLFFNKGEYVVVIASDCRPSSEKLMSAFAEGISSSSSGVKIFYIGIIHTASLFFAMEFFGASLGAMITASHNDASYNGIKFFDSDRMKFKKTLEAKVEESYLRELSILQNADNSKKQKGFRVFDFDQIYIEKVLSMLDFRNLKKIRFVCDCGGGTAYKILKEIFEKNLGLDVKFINYGCKIDGNNHSMSEVILANNSRFGIRFDSDADRIVLYDELGRIVEGEHLMARIAEHYLLNSKERPNIFVCNDMTSLSLDIYLKNRSIDVFRSDVGEKHLLETMIKNSCYIGAENSGHFIFFDMCKTSDGVLAALKLLEIINSTDLYVSEFFSDIFEIMPRILINVKVADKKFINDLFFIDLIEQKKLQNKGIARIIVRSSGTEPVIRILVEGNNLKDVERTALSIEGDVRKYGS